MGAGKSLAVGMGQAALEHGPGVASALGNGGLALASAAGQTAMDYGSSAASGLGNGALSAASGIANVASHVPEFTRQVRNLLAPHMNLSFDDLMNMAANIPSIPSVPAISSGPAPRSQSPGRPMLKDAQFPASAPARANPRHGTEFERRKNAEEWAQEPFGKLVDQIYKRPNFTAMMGVRYQKGALGKLFKGKTREQLAELLIALDAKAG